MKKFSFLLFSFLTLFFGVSCSSDDDPAPEEPGEGGNSKYVFVAYSYGSEGIESAPYIITSDKITEGTLDLSNGVETDAYSFITQNNKIFAAVWSNQGPVTPYGLDATGKVVKVGSEVNATIAAIYGTVNDNEWIGGGFSSKQSPNASLFRFDAVNYKIALTKTIDMTVTAKGTEWPDRNGVFQIDNDKLYIPYELVNTDGTGTPSAYKDEALVMVVSYPDLVYKEIITDNRTGVIGCYFGMQGIKQVEDGDIYVWSTAAGSKNPSAFLRIKKGLNVFDKDYFFNIEAKTNGWKINRGEYIGDYKFFATFHPNDEEAGLWQGKVKTGIVDVKTQTVTWITGIPEHTEMAYKDKVYVEEDQKTVQYVLADASDKIAVYNIDVASATAQKGLEFSGVKDITTISRLSY